MRRFNTEEALRALIIRFVRQHRCAVERKELSQPRYQTKNTRTRPIRRFHHRSPLLISIDARVIYVIGSRIT